MNHNQKLIDWLESALTEAEYERAFYDLKVKQLSEALQGALDVSSPQAKEQAHFLRDIERDYLTD